MKEFLTYTELTVTFLLIKIILIYKIAFYIKIKEKAGEQIVKVANFLDIENRGKYILTIIL